MSDNPYLAPTADIDNTAAGNVSNRRYMVAVCLSAVFGILGVQHFYLGRYALGVFDLALSIVGFALIASDMPLLGYLLLGIDVLHTLIVTIMLLVGAFKDGDGKLVCYPGQNVN